MNTTHAVVPIDIPNEEELHKDKTTLFGFWVYLMTDFILFASLFAVFAVLKNGTAGGPSGHDLFSGPYVLTETILLLVSSLVCGLTLLSLRKERIRVTLLGIATTVLLGCAFLYMEVREFGILLREGAGPAVSGFLSGYFVLVGTHGFHIFVGLVWGISLCIALIMRGLERSTVRKLILWAIFWHFLDVVWIFIFTTVYLTALS